MSVRSVSRPSDDSPLPQISDTFLQRFTGCTAGGAACLVVVIVVVADGGVFDGLADAAGGHAGDGGIATGAEVVIVVAVTDGPLTALK